MSRVGKAPIQLNKNVNFQIENEQLSITCGNKLINKNLYSGIVCRLSEDKSRAYLSIAKNELESSKNASRMHGTERSLIKAAVDGLLTGHEVVLELVGVGYKAVVSEGILVLTLGHSHDIIYALHKDVSVAVEKSNIIIIKSSEKRLIGTIASEIQQFRPHEPYKGKGVKIKGISYVRKEGKKK